MASWVSSSPPSMDEYSNNWDLHAVVRSYTNITNATTSDPSHCFPPRFFNDELVLKGEDKGSLFPDLETRKNAHHELEELYKPFFSITQQLPKETEMRQKQTHRSNRKKNQQKKVVCQVPADDQSSDMWAWRKYGQKPIKGSPNPRGYYRCSSSKTCLARKQVERSRTDSTILIVTYTAEHNHPIPTHRNSLAGSTRNKFPPPPSKDNADQNLPSDNKSLHPLSILTMTGLSPTTSLTTSMEDELVMVKGDYKEENNDDDEDRGMMIKDDVGSMDVGKTGDVIDDEDFVQKFFSSIWQVKGSGVTDASGR